MLRGANLSQTLVVSRITFAMKVPLLADEARSGSQPFHFL